MRSAFSVIVFSFWALRQTDESSPPEMYLGQARPGQTRPDQARLSGVPSKGETDGRRAKGNSWDNGFCGLQVYLCRSIEATGSAPQWRAR